MEIVLKDGARLEHYKLQRESLDAYHIATTSADLGSNSSYDSTTINFGAHLSRHDIHVKMANEGAECWVDGLYVVSSDQHTDTHSVIDHQQPHCTSHQLYKGILDGKSRAVFNGKNICSSVPRKPRHADEQEPLLSDRLALIPASWRFWPKTSSVPTAQPLPRWTKKSCFIETRGIPPELSKNLQLTVLRKK